MSTTAAKPTFTIGILAVLLWSSACSQSVTVRTESPAQVILAGQDLGTVGPDGVEATVQHGFAEVPYTVEVDGRRVEGTLERSELSVWPVLAGCGVTALSVPALAACGVLLVNPGLLTTLTIGVPLIEGLYAGLVYFVIAPAWPTAMAGCLGSTTGMSPLVVLGMADLPAEVTLPTPGVELEGPEQAPPPTVATRDNKRDGALSGSEVSY